MSQQPLSVFLSCGAVLKSEPLQRSFLNRLREVCSAWQREPPPVPSRRRYLLTSSHAIRNTRRKMEDRHVELCDFDRLLGLQDNTERAYFAVFDGHGGVDAATFAATHLHVSLGQQEALRSDPAMALQKAFAHTDDLFREKAKRDRLRCGSTGLAVLIEGERLHVAWLGDSQAMLVRQGQAVTLMEPHKPEREDEKRRIEDLGGCIVFMGCWRVNGTYAVSRAIGDFDQKPYISNEADCKTVPLSGAEDYVLLACDGFFDIVQPQEVAGLVLEHLQQSGGQGVGAAQSLVARAKSCGSTDNITVLLVFLRDPQDILREAAAGGGRQAETQPPEFVFFRDNGESGQMEAVTAETSRSTGGKAEEGAKEQSQ
ncbi:PPM1F phosphatase, partial [Amia calva]|nr:PPM1F phosphatase [Amia calva]